MNILKKCFFVSGLVTIASTGFSQENSGPLKLSVTEAQEYALQYNRTVQSARIDIEIAKKKIAETTAIGLPQLNFATNYTHNFVIPELSFGSYLDPMALPSGTPLTQQDILNAYRESPAMELGVKDNATFDFTVSQLIFSGEYIVGLQATKVFKEISEKSLARTESQTKETVASSYYLVLVLDENLKVLEESKKLIDQTYSDMVKMNEQGFIEETDVDQLKISVGNLQTLITSINGQKEISLKLLKLQLGVEFEQEVELTDSLGGVIDQGNKQYLNTFDFVVDKSIDFELIKTQEKLTALSLKREKWKFLPTISAFYRHQEMLKEPAINFAMKDLLGATISLPIFTSGQRLYKVQQARFELDKIKLAKDNVEQALNMEFEQARNNYQTAFSNFVTNKESMDLSRRVYDKTIIKYREGVSSSFELTQIQNQFLTAESNYYTSALSVLSAKAKLDRILTGYEKEINN